MFEKNHDRSKVRYHKVRIGTKKIVFRIERKSFTELLSLDKTIDFDLYC